MRPFILIEKRKEVCTEPRKYVTTPFNSPDASSPTATKEMKETARWGLLAPPPPLRFLSPPSFQTVATCPYDDMDCQQKTSDTVPYSPNVFFEFVVPGVLLNGVGLLGLVGNILSIIVLSRPQMKSSINCILIGKAYVLLKQHKRSEDILQDLVI